MNSPAGLVTSTLLSFELFDAQAAEGFEFLFLDEGTIPLAFVVRAMAGTEGMSDDFLLISCLKELEPF